jgi:uncharacterized protein (TIGR00369 family)
MNRDEVANYLATVFPEINRDGEHFAIESVRYGGAQLRLIYNDRFIRPGGTISGPAMFALADYALYVAILATIGKVPLAVTTNATINFLRRPAAVDLMADVDLIKIGRRLVVGAVSLASVETEDLVAHVTATYSIPPRK